MTIRPLPRHVACLRRGMLALLATTGLLVGVTVAVAAPDAGAVSFTVTATAKAKAPRTPVGLPRSIEGYAPYQQQIACDPRVRPGVVKLAHLLMATYPGVGASWGSARACGADLDHSEHYDGRALDWMVHFRKPAQRAAANAVVAWLLARDAAGNPAAMARRLGVMYLIWNNRIWGSWGGWEDYNGCTRSKAMLAPAYDNACHRDHVHFSLSWNGAMGQTSFWAKRVFAVNQGPCRPRDLNWAGRYYRTNTRPCADYPTVRAPRTASATKKALVRWSGAEVRLGSTGPVVTALQKRFGVPATGRYDLRTVNAVKAFQRAHRLPVHGIMFARVWRALLAATR